MDMDSSYDFDFPQRFLQQTDISGMDSNPSQSSAESSNASVMQTSDPGSTSQGNRSQSINGQVHYFGPYSPPAFSFSTFSLDPPLNSTSSWVTMLTGNDMNRSDRIPNPETDDMDFDMETEPPSTEVDVVDAVQRPVNRTSSPEVPFPFASNDHNYARRESSREQTSPEVASNPRFTFRRLPPPTANTSTASPSSSLEGQADNSIATGSSSDSNNGDGFRSRFSARLRNASRSLLGAVTGRRSASPEYPLPQTVGRRSATTREVDRPRRVLRPPSRSNTSRFTDIPPSFDTFLSNLLPRSGSSSTVSKLTETGLNASSKKKIVPKLKETMQKLGIDSDQPRSSRAMTPDKCSICLEVPTKLTASLTFPCLHTFCEECISHWVKTKNSCPNCQANVTRIVYNLRSEHDYDVKPVEERNELMNPGLPVEGDFFEIFWQLHRNRLERQRQNRVPERTVTEPARTSVARQTVTGRGNPYINRNPIREAYQVGSLFDRTFPDQPNAEIQALVLVNGFEVSRVSFRRRVYAENLQGGVGFSSVEQVRLAPSQLTASTTGYQGYWDRLQPWLRREITAAMIPESSNAQREHAFAVIGHVMRVPSGVQMAAFTSAVDENFMSATRALKFWDEMTQFLLSRTQMGVWDRAMKYFDVNGNLVAVPSTTVPSFAPVRGRDYVVYDIAETEHSDSDDSVQFIGTVTNTHRPARSVTTTSSIVANFDEDDSMNSLDDEYIPTRRPTSSMYTSDADSERVTNRRRLRSPSLSSNPSDDDFIRTVSRAARSSSPPRRTVSRAVRDEPSRSSRYATLRRLARVGSHRRRIASSSEESSPSPSRSSSRSHRRRESSQHRSRSSRPAASSSRRTEPRRDRRLEQRARTTSSRSDRRSARR